ncbi:DUF1365 domain-containing protein [uncultured Microbulbifer sp.]|uniref:DUF1365 domain-containing protein n=1 Tax=uncultured Microbulbifer sp. TaxID=348147 RepID=UPI00262452E8|nr:DUF1365 domain-containing protein [uncultured Microbulbifer sp.]
MQQPTPISSMHSAIYSGWVQHRRFAPRAHHFRYQVFMVYLDLAELAQLSSRSVFWGEGPWALARFRRADFFGDAQIPLDEAVRNRIEEEAGTRPTGPIRVLANWRYFGVNMNPISIYYCFDETGSQVQWLLLDVHNTPWNERHGYVLDCRNQNSVQKTRFDKAMHVSPFMPMEQVYHWRSCTPGKRLTAFLQNVQEDTKVHDATLSLTRHEVSAKTLNRVLIQYPLMTVKVIAAIYWQALKLWLKRIPVIAHPSRQSPPQREPEEQSE